VGDVFVIVDNDMADAVSGIFTSGATSLTDGLVFEVNVTVFTIQYDYNADTGQNDDSGNDVALISAGPAETEVSLDASGNLVITDINTDSADSLTIVETTVGGQLGILVSDANLTLTNTASNGRSVAAGSVRPDANSVFVAYATAGFTGNVIVNTPNETNSTDTNVDAVTIQDLDLATNGKGGLVVNAEGISLNGSVRSDFVTLNGIRDNFFPEISFIFVFINEYPPENIGFKKIDTHAAQEGSILRNTLLIAGKMYEFFGGWFLNESFDFSGCIYLHNTKTRCFLCGNRLGGDADICI
jgi:hypothetical protein